MSFCYPTLYRYGIESVIEKTTKKKTYMLSVALRKASARH
jgi:hypothetical protein